MQDCVTHKVKGIGKERKGLYFLVDKDVNCPKVQQMIQSAEGYQYSIAESHLLNNLRYNL